MMPSPMKAMLVMSFSLVSLSRFEVLATGSR